MMKEKQWRWALLNWILLWTLPVLFLSGAEVMGAQTATSAGSVQATSTEPVPSTSTSSAQALPRYSVQAVTDPAGEPPYYELGLSLRYSDGTAVAGEPIVLERLPEELPMPCVTDATGRCTWTVGRGLYQAIFERPLDQVSTLSLAEGGLRGFGLTVGEADIIYHFTFHHDGRAYFDAAPDAAVPDPIIPHFHSLQGGMLPLLDHLDLVGTPAEGPTVTPTPNEPNEDMTVTASTGTAVFWLVGLGLLLGGGLHLLQRHWPQPTHRHRLASPLTATTKSGRSETTAADVAGTTTATAGPTATAGTTAVAGATTATGQTDADDAHTSVDPTSNTNPPPAAAAEEENHHA
jgi:hypothetical protein